MSRSLRRKHAKKSRGYKEYPYQYLFYGCYDDSPPPPKKTVINFYGEGWKLFREQHYKEAIETRAKELAISPRNISILNSIGIGHHELGDYQTALEYQNKALEIDPHYAYPYYSRGRTYLALKNYQLAESDFLKAIELKWDLPNSYYNLLVTYKKMGDCGKAEQFLAKLREIGAFVKEGEKELTDCHLMSGQGEEVVQRLAIILKSNDPGTHDLANKKLGGIKHPKAVDLLISILS